MIEGFRAGCDDYIAKPFSVELLYQRIEAVLRRSENALDGVKHERFHYGDMSVDFERMQVYISDEPIKLSVTEYRILELLIKNKGRVLTRDMIDQPSAVFQADAYLGYPESPCQVQDPAPQI